MRPNILSWRNQARTPKGDSSERRGDFANTDMLQVDHQVNFWCPRFNAFCERNGPNDLINLNQGDRQIFCSHLVCPRAPSRPHGQILGILKLLMCPGFWLKYGQIPHLSPPDFLVVSSARAPLIMQISLSTSATAWRFPLE